MGTDFVEAFGDFNLGTDFVEVFGDFNLGTGFVEAFGDFNLGTGCFAALRRRLGTGHFTIYFLVDLRCTYRVDGV